LPRKTLFRGESANAKAGIEIFEADNGFSSSQEKITSFCSP